MFLKEVSYAHQGGIYLIKNKVKTGIILWKHHCNYFTWHSWFFSIITPVFMILQKSF